MGTKWPGLSLILLFVVLFAFGVFVISKPSSQTETTNNKADPTQDTVTIERAPTELEATVSNKFDELISRAQGDIEQVLNQKIKITVYIGRYFRYVGFVALLNTYYEPHYYLNLDGEFLEELTEKEINAVILHELGHILYRPPLNPDFSQATEAEVLADSFITKYPEYTSTKDAISLLDKAHSPYLIRRKNLEKIAQSQ